MNKRSNRFPYGVEYWAAESVQEQSDQSALMMDHIVRTQLRFWLFVAALLAIAISSLALEYIRHFIGGVAINVWRWLGGIAPGLLGLVAILGVSAAFVRDVYGIPSWRAAFGYVWLLLFGRAPLSLMDFLLKRPLVRLFSALGLSLPVIAPVAPYPFLIVREGQIDKKHKDTPLARLGGPGNMGILNDSAVFLERFGRFSRVAGPGKIFLRRFERIREVLDLRPQERSQVVTALTKDGIPVQTEVQVRFQLMRPPASLPPSKSGIPRPVHKWAWTRAGQSQSRLIILDEGWERENHWPERVMGNVGGTMRAIIAGYRLDELLEPYEPERDPCREISQRLHHQLDAAARDFGAQVLEVRMGALEPASDRLKAQVKEKRIASWQAIWKSKARQEEAKGQAEAIRELGLAHAYAQMEIILTLAREFQDAVERRVVPPDEIIILRFMEAVRQTWSRPEGAFVSPQIFNMWQAMQRDLQRLAGPGHFLPRGETGVNESYEGQERNGDTETPPGSGGAEDQGVADIADAAQGRYVGQGQDKATP